MIQLEQFKSFHQLVTLTITLQERRLNRDPASKRQFDSHAKDENLEQTMDVSYLSCTLLGLKSSLSECHRMRGGSMAKGARVLPQSVCENKI